MIDCCKDKATARHYGSFEGPGGWYAAQEYECGCRRRAAELAATRSRLKKLFLTIRNWYESR